MIHVNSLTDCLPRVDQDCAGERPVHPLPQALQRRRQDDPGGHEDQLPRILLQSERALSLFPFLANVGNLKSVDRITAHKETNCPS